MSYHVIGRKSADYSRIFCLFCRYRQVSDSARNHIADPAPAVVRTGPLTEDAEKRPAFRAHPGRESAGERCGSRRDFMPGNPASGHPPTGPPRKKTAVPFRNRAGFFGKSVRSITGRRKGVSRARPPCHGRRRSPPWRPACCSDSGAGRRDGRFRSSRRRPSRSSVRDRRSPGSRNR